MGYYEFKESDALEFARASGIKAKQEGMSFSFCIARTVTAEGIKETRERFLLI